MEARNRIQREDISTGNMLRNRSWSHGLDNEENISSQNRLLNETNEPRYIDIDESIYRNYL